MRGRASGLGARISSMVLLIVCSSVHRSDHLLDKGISSSVMPYFL